MTSLDWNDGPLAAGLHCYRTEQFFDAHEHWEGVWLKCAEPDKTFLQALIQITAAFHHFQKGNPAGTRSLLRASLCRLEGYPGEYGGVALEPLRDSVRLWLATLDRDDRPLKPAFPQIR